MQYLFKYQNHRFLLRICLCLYLICFLQVLFAQKSVHQNVKTPNIIIILADDLGWNDVSLHGSEIKTPNIDALIKSGIKLNRFYVAPICSPTRAGLLTGKYPNRFGLRDYVISPVVKYGLPPQEVTIAEALAKAGYKHRGAFGKWHLGHSSKKYHPLQQGFTFYYGHYNGAIDYFTHNRSYQLDWHRNYEPSFDKGYSTDLIANEVIEFIHEKSKGPEPFFAYVPFNAPHAPMQAKHEHLLQYGFDPDRPLLQIGNNPSNRGYNESDPGYGAQGNGNSVRQTYAAMVASLDENIGRIIEYLDKNSLRENTIIWFMSDNGGEEKMGGNNFPLRGQKYSEWEGGVRVISSISWPEKIKAGGICNELTAYIDVLPTLLNLVGGTDNIKRDGINIWPAISDNTTLKRDLFLGGDAVVNKEWKLNKGELFRIDEDPNEKNNLAGTNLQQLRVMLQLLEEFKKINITLKPERQPTGWKAPVYWNIPD